MKPSNVNTPLYVKGRVHREAGIVLIITLIMLGMFSLIVVSMVASSNINFKIAGNHQYRLEAKSAARNALESYISNSANFQLPLPESNSYVASDFNGDGVTDMTASIPPPDCVRAVPVPMPVLDIADPQDAQCLVGQLGNANSGLISDASMNGGDNSWCSKMNWDVRAAVADTKTGANVGMRQGVYVRAVIGTPCPVQSVSAADQNEEEAG